MTGVEGVAGVQQGAGRPALRFGFEVTYEEPYYDGDSTGWRVFLPHQCGRWDIADETETAEPVPHDVAVARLEQFIAEAQDALAALRAGKEYPEEDQ